MYLNSEFSRISVIVLAFELVANSTRVPIYLSAMLTVKLNVNESEKLIEVADSDMPEPMYWNAAKKTVDALGDRWRMPSSDELWAMYDQRFLEDKGDFKKEGYWTGELKEVDEDFGEIYNWIDFYDGILLDNPEHTLLNVRAVRDLN